MYWLMSFWYITYTHTSPQGAWYPLPFPLVIFFRTLQEVSQPRVIIRRPGMFHIKNVYR